MHNITIETERLLLRPLTVDDAPAVFEWVSDEQVARYMVYNTYENIEQVNEWLASSIQKDAEECSEYHFGFVRKSDGKLIGSGSIGPDSQREGFWGFGYNFRRDSWGMGYATEAARAMIQFAHDALGATRFSSSHVEPNRASGRVMEKCGLHFACYGEFRKLDGSGHARSMDYVGDWDTFLQATSQPDVSNALHGNGLYNLLNEIEKYIPSLSEYNLQLFPNTDFLKNNEIQLVLEKTVPGNAEKGWVPAYHFAICNPAGTKMGVCDLRIGHNDALYYGGNIGYRIEEEYRGHHYAGKACLLLFELARKHGLDYLIITCNPDNFPSRKTCEYAGGTLLEIAQLPEVNDMRCRGETEKCIYRFEL